MQNSDQVKKTNKQEKEQNNNNKNYNLCNEQHIINLKKKKSSFEVLVHSALEYLLYWAN